MRDSVMPFEKNFKIFETLERCIEEFSYDE